MKLTSIPGLVRNLRRGREILAVLQRYGLAEGLSLSRRLPMQGWIKDRSGVPLTQYSRVERVRMAITELGPTFIKLGQVLSSRPDLVGTSLADELKRLRGNVRPDSMEQVETMLRSELGDTFREHFDSIESTPLATASIGQVHRATMRDGRRVVIKVQRSGIDPMMRQDLDVLAGLAQLAQRVETLAAWGPSELVRQLAPMILRELDFRREKANLKQFTALLGDKADVIAIPAVVESLCTRRVLVMDELVGVPLVQALAKADPKTNSNEHRNDPGTGLTHHGIGSCLAETYLRMVFEEGVFHADPHSGNLMRLEDGRLGILDFGMVGRIDESLRESIEEMLLAIHAGDRRRLTRLIRRVGRPRDDLDHAALEIDVADFIDTFGRQSMDRFDVGAALNALSDILHGHGIGLPNQSALLLKMMMSLEGTLRELGVGFDSLEIVQTQMRHVMVRRLSPSRRLRQARRVYLENEALLEEAPEQVLNLLGQARRGELSLRLEAIRLPTVINRLVVGLMASAVFLGSSLLLAYEVSPVLFPDAAFMGISRLSVLGVLGVVASITVMTLVCWGIFRDG
ncbi:MAG: AarF/UbiB family protein [Planctomycetota bacterium]